MEATSRIISMVFFSVVVIVVTAITRDMVAAGATIATLLFGISIGLSIASILLDRYKHNG